MIIVNHADNSEKKFSVQDEGITYGINGSFGLSGKILVIISVNTNFCLSLHYNGNSYLFLNKKEIFKLKANNKKPKFPTQLCLSTMM